MGIFPLSLPHVPGYTARRRVKSDSLNVMTGRGCVHSIAVTHAGKLHKVTTLTMQKYQTFRAPILLSVQADSRRTVVAHNVIRRQVVKPFCRCAIFYAASDFSCIRPNDLMGKQHERTYFAITIKLRFHIHRKRKLYALCVMRYMATMEKHVNGRICPDTTCGWSCGCESLRMRRTESLHVAIHAEKKCKKIGCRKLGNQ